MRHLYLALVFTACGGDSNEPEVTAEVAEVSDATDAIDATDTEPDRDTFIRPEVDAEVVEPLIAPEGVWTWFPQPGSACSDGSETGFAVNTGTTNDVLIVFMGGGACWDFNTCFLIGAAQAGPFGKAQFVEVHEGISVGVLDRDDDANPYRTWTQVFVPYCTGDLHAGDHVATYTEGGITRQWHHMGATNAALARARLVATFPKPDHLVVAGLSAGGYGATLQYALMRDAFDPTTSQLVDDSGPFLIGDAMPATMRSAWFTNWRLDHVVDPVCGQDCKSSLATLYSKLAARYPDDRMALVSSLQDEVISAYMLMLQPAFEVALRQLGADVLAPLPNVRTFFVAGNSHTTLGNPAAFSVQGTDLRTWLGAMLAGDATWTSLSP